LPLLGRDERTSLVSSSSEDEHDAEVPLLVDASGSDLVDAKTIGADVQVLI